MEKREVVNRKKQKISVLIEDGKKGIVVIMHGLGRNKEMPLLESIAKVFKENGYTTIRFDTTNTFGGSDGNFEDATTTNYYEDLEDVIKWIKSKHKEKIVLIGHSLGGLCTGLFAENFPSEIKALALVSTIISGKFSMNNYPKEVLDFWKEKGALEWSEDGKNKRLKWQFMAEADKYDLLLKSKFLKMPVLMIAGSKDNESPFEQNKILFDRLPGKKEIHVVEGAGHLFNEKAQLEEVERYFDKWIKTNL